MVNYYQQLQATIDYIEDNLSETLTLGELAQVACFSDFHFHRLFQMVIGESVMAYVRKRRLATAAFELANSDTAVLEIALNHGFQSHETFTRTFRRVFTMTPAEYRRRQVNAPLYPPANVLVRQYNPYLGGMQMNFKIVEVPETKVAGFELRTNADGRNHKEIPEFWQTYLRENRASRIPNPVDNSELGICTKFDLETGDFSYLIGMHVEGSENVPEDLVTHIIPAARYAVFTTPKVKLDEFSDSIQQTWKSIFEEWFPHSGYEHAGTDEYEYYDERCHQSKNELVQMDIYIPIRET